MTSYVCLSGEEAEPFISCAVSLLKMAASAQHSGSLEETQWRLRWLVAGTAAAALHHSCSAGSLNAPAEQELETATCDSGSGTGGAARTAVETSSSSGSGSSGSSGSSTFDAAMLVLIGRCMLQWAAELQHFGSDSDWLAEAQQLLTTS